MTRLSIKAKLFGGFLAMAFIVLTMGSFGYFQLAKVNEKFSTLMDSDLKLYAVTQDMEYLLLMHRRFEKDMFLNIGNQEKQEGYLRKFNAQKQQMHDAIALLQKLYLATEDLSSEGRQNAEALTEFYEKYCAGFSQIAQRAISGVYATSQEANKAMTPFKQNIYDFEQKLKRIIQATKNMLQQNKTESLAIAKDVQGVMIAAMPIGFIVALSLGLVLALPITKKLRRAVEFTRRIGKGDFSSRLPISKQVGYSGESDHGSNEIDEIGLALNSLADDMEDRAGAAKAIADGDLTQRIRLASDQDDFGKALQKMTDDLETIVSQVLDMTTQVNAGAAQVSDTSQSLSQGATEQASSLEEITSSITEIASQTKQNAENAQQAKQIATANRDVADKGNEQMHQMVGAMTAINDSSQQISKIIKTIDDIAFQTNLLALNAAVEAARAGKYGKGFAVVAEEVRGLAARSAKAAKETAELIEGSHKKVENGMEIANYAAQALSDIVSNVTKVSDLVGEIAAASNEQAQAVSQINQGLEQIESVTQQSTANAEETASAAEQLSSQAQLLQRLMSRFKIRNSAESELALLPPQKASLPSLARKSKPGQLQPKTVDGWGEEVKASWEPSTNPGDVISLDDREFGRY